MVGALVLYLVRRPVTPTATTNLTANTSLTNQTNSTAKAPVFRRYTITASADQDRDGLTDTQEEQVGTNPVQADTDGDGLSDYDEVKVYHTDPRKADSDGDGVGDGQEVRQGTNPIGSGTLLNINQAVQHLTNK